MSVIQKEFNRIDGNLITMKRDTVNGWYVFEIGIPKSWVYESNDDIECEEITENKLGYIIKVSPKNDKISIDDLISFVEIIISTNKKISQKEEEFKVRMEDLKLELEEEAKKFYEELDNLKDNSFKLFKEESKKDTDKAVEPKKVNTTKSKTEKSKKASTNKTNTIDRDSSNKK